MRFIFTILLGLALLWGNSQVFACEHSSATTSVSEVSSIHQQYKAVIANVKVSQSSFCCSGVSMICCLTVANNLNIVNPNFLVSEELSIHADTYKSYVAYTLQRPPCKDFI